MALSQLLGQPRVNALFGRALASGRVHHAYLLAGPPGCGKTLAARLLAQALNCESPAAVEAAARGLFVTDPCGECLSCRRIDDSPKKHAHPLVMWVDTEAQMVADGLFSPEGDRVPPKMIGVRLLRELVLPRLSLRAVGGRRKVAILRDVDFGDAAQNALLKTLEEPPADTTFLLLSSSPDALKLTIRSRCVRVVFRPLAQSEVAERVARQAGTSPEESRLRAALSSGNLGAALSLDAKALQRRRDTVLAFDAVEDTDVLGWLNLAEALGEKDKALTALEHWMAWLHDVLLCAAGGAPATHVDLEAAAQARARRLGPVEAMRRLERLQRARQAIEGNGQARLQLEAAFLSMAGVEPLSLGEG